MERSRRPKTEIAIRQVGKKNMICVKVGELEAGMFTDSSADVSIVPSNSNW